MNEMKSSCHNITLCGYSVNKQIIKTFTEHTCEKIFGHRIEREIENHQETNRKQPE